MIPAVAFLLILVLLLVGFALRRRRTRRQRAAMTRQLYAWAERSEVLEPALKQWLQRLPAPEAAALTTQLNRHCANLNWDLTWLFSPQFERAPVLKQAVEETVAAYARAMLTGLQTEDDVRAYRAYLAFDRKPTARKRRALVQALYARLVEEGLVARPNTARGMWAKLPGGGKRKAKPPARSEQVAAIRQAFEENPAQAMEALKQVLAADAQREVAQARTEASSAGIEAPGPAAVSLG